MTQELSERILRYLDGELSENEERDLAALLERDRDAQQRYAQILRIHGNIPAVLTEISSEQAEVRPLPAASLADETAWQPKIHGDGRTARATRHVPPSSRRPRPLAVKPPESWAFFALIAAALLVGLTVFIHVAKAPSAPTGKDPEAEARRAAEEQRKAQRDLAASEETWRKARQEAARVSAERAKAQERLQELNRERPSVAQAPVKTLPDAERLAEEEKRQREAARLEEQRRVEQATLAEAEAAQRKAEESLAQAEEARRIAREQATQKAAKVPDLGQIVFIADRSADRAAPILVRSDGERIVLKKGQTVAAGERIETARSAAGAPGHAVQAALELWSGATVDLAEGTAYALIDEGSGRITCGQLYADVSGEGSPGAEADPRKPARRSFRIQSLFADLTTRGARFHLAVEAAQDRLRLEEGAADFGNARGRQGLTRLQESTVRENEAPSTPVPLEAAALWRGRRGPLPVPAADPSYAFQDGVLPVATYAGTRCTYLMEDEPNKNFSSEDILVVDGDVPENSGKDAEILLKWDLSRIPVGARVQSVVITLQVTNPTDDGAYHVHGLKHEWEETQATWSASGRQRPWQSPGALGVNDRTTALLGSTTAEVAEGECNIKLNTDGVALVQAWINTPANNYGFLMANTENTDGLWVASRKAVNPRQRPKLTVLVAEERRSGTP